MIYLVVLLILVALSIQYDLRMQNRSHTTLAVLVMMMLALIAGLRYEIGSDTLRYMDWLKSEAPTLDTFSSFDFEAIRYQPGFILLCAICKSITSEFTLFQLVHAILLNLAILYFLKKNTSYVFLSLLFYFLLNYLEFNTEIIRESLAVASTLIAYLFFKRKKYVWACMLWFVAFMFHVSALAALLYPLIARVKYTSKTAVVLLIVLLVVPIFYQMLPDQTQLIIALTGQETYSGYFIQEFNSRLNSNFYVWHIFRYVLFPSIALYYVYKRSPQGVEFAGFVYLYMIFQTLSMFTYGFYRFANYYAPFYWMFLAQFTYTLYRHQANKRITLIYLSVIIILVLYLYQHFLLGPDVSGGIIADRYFPYKSVLFN